MPYTNLVFKVIDKFLTDFEKFANVANASFFPLSINHSEFYDLNEKPCLNMFLLMTDSDTLQEKKEEYFETLKKEWNFKEQIKG